MRLINLCTVIALALAGWGCSQTTPVGPTPLGQASVRSAPEAIASALAPGRVGGGATSAGMSVSWDCFSGAGAFGSTSSCPAPRWTADDVQVGAVVTAAPTNLERGVSGSTVNLRWGAPPGNSPTSYVIEAGTGPGLSNITTFNTGNAATSLTVNNVPPGAYFVRVRGRDASGNGPASNEVTITVLGGGGPGPGSGGCTGFGAPTNLTAIVIGPAVALGWRTPTTGCEPRSYRVVAGSSPGMSDLAVVDTAPTYDTSFTVANAPVGTYYIRVRAVDGATVGPFSNEVQVTVTGIVPAGTSIWSGLVANGDGITVSNDPDCGSLRFDITLRLVQSGSSVTGFGTIIVRAASSPACSDGIGVTFSGLFTGTASGSLASGSGTFTVVSLGGGNDTTTITGTFANGRMTGTFTDEDGGGTFSANRQP